MSQQQQQFAVGYIRPLGQYVLLAGEVHPDKPTAMKAVQELNTRRKFGAGGDRYSLKYKLFEVREIENA